MLDIVAIAVRAVCIFSLGDSPLLKIWERRIVLNTPMGLYTEIDYVQKSVLFVL